MTPDVLVVGAGPAGAAVSILLARHGYQVVLLDRAQFPRDKACAEYLSPACTPILEHLGVLDAVRASSPQHLHGMRITDYRGRSCVGHFVQDGVPLSGFALPRWHLDALLVQQARRVGVTVHEGFWARQPLLHGTRVVGVEGRHGACRETIHARLVIAADGLHSTLVRRLGLVRRIRWLRHVAMVTHYTGIDALQPLGDMFLLPTGYLGLAPVTENRVNVSLVVRTAHFSGTADTLDAFFAQTIATHPELRQRFARATRVKPYLTIGPMAQRTVVPAHDGILCVGDAAGFFDPFTGQGIYLALQSAVLAATTGHQALGHDDVSAQRLHAYWRAHRQAFRDKYRLSQFIQLGLRVPWLANRAIAGLARCPALADTVVGVTGDFLSPKTVLSWRFAARVLWGGGGTQSRVEA